MPKMAPKAQERKQSRSKTQKPKSDPPTNAESSDSDSYNGVNEISDDDEDDPDVEEAEEQHLKETGFDDVPIPRPINDDDEEDEEDYTEEDQVLGHEIDFFHDQIGHHDYDEELKGLLLDHGDAGDLIGKRVRFVEDESEDSDLESPDSAFPDLLDRDSLNPRFLRAIEHGNSEDDQDSDESYWDHRNEDNEVGNLFNQGDEQEDEEDEEYDSDESSDLSGYDSDATTDDDLPTIVRASQVQINADSASTRASSAEEERPRSRGSKQLHTPKMGRWTADANTPFAVIDSDGKKMILFNRTALKLAADPEQVGASLQSPMRHIIDSSPMMSNSANIMMSAASSGAYHASDFEAFYPRSFGGTFHDPGSSSFEYEDTDDIATDNLIDEFFDFGDEESSDEKDNEEEDPFTDTTAEPASTPSRPTTSGDGNHRLLDHFNKVDVNAFRRDQSRKQLLLRNVESKDSLTFGAPFLEGTIRGIKSDRLQQATVPITPVRKRKGSKSTNVLSSPGSPLVRAEANKKRGYDGDDFSGHKRNRSQG